MVKIIFNFLYLFSYSFYLNSSFVILSLESFRLIFIVIQESYKMLLREISSSSQNDEICFHRK